MCKLTLDNVIKATNRLAYLDGRTSIICLALNCSYGCEIAFREFRYFIDMAADVEHYTGVS
jgi:hypothetical protein